MIRRLNPETLGSLNYRYGTEILITRQRHDETRIPGKGHVHHSQGSLGVGIASTVQE